MKPNQTKYNFDKLAQEIEESIEDDFYTCDQVTLALEDTDGTPCYEILVRKLAERSENE